MHDQPDVADRRTRQHAGVAGAAAAAVALGVGELVSGFDRSGSSLVSVVGDEFVDRFAGPLKNLAIALFGTNDKAALLTGIVIVALLVGARAGVATLRRAWVGPAVIAAFGLVGLWAFVVSPLASAGVGVVASALAVAAGVGTLRGLLALAPRPAPVPADGVAGAGGRILAAPGAPAGGAPRRQFLGVAAATTVGAGVLAATGRSLRAPDPGEAVRTSTVVPPAGTPLAVDTSDSFVVDGLSPYVTPTADFYRIDTALTIPRVDVTTWKLGIGGRVDQPFQLTYDELLALPSVEEVVTMQCVSNEVGGYLVGNAVWQGVPLIDLLERAGLRDDSEQVVGTSVDGFTAGFPTELLLDGRTALVAYAMNGELLPALHGFPARLVVAGLYGYVSATKWLDRIELTRLDEVDGFWIPRGWSKDGPIKLASRIDVPRSGQRFAPGPTAVAGLAWAPTVGIAKVEVRVDDGPWVEARLGDRTTDETWVQWVLEWDAPVGEHRLTVRAVDADGQVQTDEVRPPAPDGATGLHARRVFVE